LFKATGLRLLFYHYKIIGGYTIAQRICTGQHYIAFFKFLCVDVEITVLRNYLPLLFGVAFKPLGDCLIALKIKRFVSDINH
jgi:hypothetical protein